MTTGSENEAQVSSHWRRQFLSPNLLTPKEGSWNTWFKTSSIFCCKTFGNSIKTLKNSSSFGYIRIAHHSPEVSKGRESWIFERHEWPRCCPAIYEPLELWRLGMPWVLITHSSCLISHSHSYLEFPDMSIHAITHSHVYIYIYRHIHYTTS